MHGITWEEGFEGGKLLGTVTFEKIGPTDLDALAADLGVKPHAVRERRHAMIVAAPAAWEALLAIPGLAQEGKLLMEMRRGWDERVKRLSAKR